MAKGAETVFAEDLNLAPEPLWGHSSSRESDVSGLHRHIPTQRHTFIDLIKNKNNLRIFELAFNFRCDYGNCCCNTWVGCILMASLCNLSCWSLVVLCTPCTPPHPHSAEIPWNVLLFFKKKVLAGFGGMHILPQSWETAAGGLWVWRQPGLHRKTSKFLFCFCFLFSLSGFVQFFCYWL